MPDPVYYINTVKNPSVSPGYTQKALVASKSWFRAIAGNDTDVTTRISGAHAFEDELDWVTCYALPNSVMNNGSLNGENGAKNALWKPQIFFPGDAPELQQMLEVLKNDDLLFLIQDIENGGNGYYWQFGSDLLPSQFASMSFGSGTVYGTEMKGWKVEIISACRYLYKGNVHRRFGQRFGMRFR